MADGRGESLLTIHTTWGPIRLVASQGRLARCVLPLQQRPRSKAPRVLASSWSSASPADRSVLRAGEKMIRAALRGKTVDAIPTLADDGLTPFAKACRAAMLAIPMGTTISYAELARRAGRPGAARAAGQICARNPLPLIVPCHRVCAADRSPGGFSAGLGWKMWLLKAERAI
ncbi:MAG: methylated-DNA--[protein]-cysteine S-methyltransferase [Kiritimatiellae bacterium]|nr:methylated-DNA--[protein]-cysteine S-methyltransferase [Kiritimatiellia bacterium]MDW8458604.1 methylated-DNA--[protein]-cysteine S-methyltransferase [Verrucomicrobiota bacterium]